MANAAKFIIPGVVLIGVAMMAGGAKAKKKRPSNGGGGYEPLPGEDPRPEDDRMLFDDGCNDLIVRVRAADYDLRITDAYWMMRQEGVDDPEVIAVEILKMDAPQCQWPPGPDASLRSKSIWELVYPAVDLYWSFEKAGTLDQFAQVFGTAEGFIE